MTDINTQIEENRNEIEVLQNAINDYTEIINNAETPDQFMKDETNNYVTSHIKTLTDPYDIKKWKRILEESKTYNAVQLTVLAKTVLPGWIDHAMHNHKSIKACDVKVGTHLLLSHIVPVVRIKKHKSIVQIYYDNDKNIIVGLDHSLTEITPLEP